MKHKSKISYQNPNNRLNNGITLDSPRQKKTKFGWTTGKFMASVCLDADGILMVDYLQNTSCDWNVEIK